MISLISKSLEIYKTNRLHSDDSFFEFIHILIFGIFKYFDFYTIYKVSCFLLYIVIKQMVFWHYCNVYKSKFERVSFSPSNGYDIP